MNVLKVLIAIAVVGAFLLLLNGMLVDAQAEHARSVEVAKRLGVTLTQLEHIRDSFRAIGMRDLKIIDSGILHFGNNYERCKHFDRFETIETQGCKVVTEDLVKLGVITRSTP